MQPNAYEIEEVGNAFVSISYFTYTSEELTYLMKFLKHYARDLNLSELKKHFGNKMKIIDAMKTLYDFALQYEDEKEVYSEFKEEIDELIISLNRNENMINL